MATVCPAPEWTLLQVRVMSFGYRWSPDPARLAYSGRCEITVDLRSVLHNPHIDPAMRELTGWHPRVRDHVLGTPGAVDVLTATARLAVAVLDRMDRRGLAVTIAFGCAGGRHRSVVLANELRSLLERQGIGADVEHFDVLRPVWTPDAGSRS